MQTSDPCASKEVEVKNAEIKLAGFLVEHNISFKTIDHLCPLLTNIFPDSKIAKELALKRSKTTNIVKNVIAENYKKKLTEYLKRRKFSVLIDESTDISTVKTICIVVRYFDSEKHKVKTSLWELVPLYTQEADVARQGTAENLFNIVTNSFIKKNISLNNIIGFASDGCNLMMGEHNLVASRFKQRCPGIIILKCICHSLHICSSQACKCLPRSCEDLARNIYTFFKVYF